MNSLENKAQALYPFNTLTSSSSFFPTSSGGSSVNEFKPNTPFGAHVPHIGHMYPIRGIYAARILAWCCIKSGDLGLLCPVRGIRAAAFLDQSLAEQAAHHRACPE